MTLLYQDGDLSVSQFEFQNAPPLWITVLLLLPAIGLFVGLIYRREAASARSRARAFLAIVRMAVLVAVLLILFQPVNKSQVFSVSRSLVAVLFDESHSMQRREDYDPELEQALARAASLAEDESVADLARVDLVKRVLAGPERPLEALQEKVDLQYFAFAESTRPLTSVGEVSASGDVTAIGDALSTGLNQLRHRNLSGLIVVTDGQSNRGRDMMDVARLAASDGVPIHAVGVGNPAEPRNVGILGVNAPTIALVNDEVAIEVTLISRGYEGQPADLVVRERTSGEELTQSSFTLSGGGSEQVETVYFKPQREGEYVLEISIPVKPGEQFSDDNQRLHHLRVEPEVIRVLYVEGRPRWEYRFLKSTLLRAENFKVQILATWASPDVIQDSSEGVPALTRFPPTRQDLFEYDVLMLGDIAPDKIDTHNSRGSVEDLLREIQEFVEVGGGLILIAGELHSPRDYQDTPIADILPVEIGNTDEGEVEKQDRGPFRPRLPDPLRPHDVVRLEKDLELNQKLLQDPEFGLPPQRWYAAVRRAKQGAEILLQHPTNGNRYGPHVLAATTQIPDGRTMFIGFDETWLWRRPYENRYTERFWRAAIRHVAIGKLRRSNKRFDLRTDKEKYNLGEMIQVSARILDEDFRPLTEPSHLIRMQRGEGAVEELLAYAQEPGTFDRTVRADLPGTYRLWLEEPGEGDRKLSQRTVEVEVPRLEVLNPALDQARLTAVAELSGGKYLGLQDFGELSDIVRGDSRRIPVRTEQKDLWDRWEVFGILLLLLTVEWAVRKRFNLL